MPSPSSRLARGGKIPPTENGAGAIAAGAPGPRAPDSGRGHLRPPNRRPPPAVCGIVASYCEACGAIALYRGMGFEARLEMPIRVMSRTA